MKKILFYGLDGETLRNYTKILEQSNISVGSVGDDVLDIPLNELLTKSDSFHNLHQKYKYKYMITNDISIKDITLLMKIFAKHSKPFMGVTISCTKNNVTWKLGKLLEENAKEFEIFGDIVLIKNLLNEFKDINLQSLELHQKRKLEHLKQKMAGIKNPKQTTKEETQHILNALQQLMNALNKRYN